MEIAPSRQGSTRAREEGVGLAGQEKGPWLWLYSGSHRDGFKVLHLHVGEALVAVCVFITNHDDLFDLANLLKKLADATLVSLHDELADEHGALCRALAFVARLSFAQWRIAPGTGQNFQGENSYQAFRAGEREKLSSGTWERGEGCKKERLRTWSLVRSSISSSCRALSRSSAVISTGDALRLRLPLRLRLRLLRRRRRRSWDRLRLRLRRRPCRSKAKRDGLRKVATLA